MRSPFTHRLAVGAVIVALALSGELALGAKQNKFIAVTSYYTAYSDLTLSNDDGSETKEAMAPSLGVEIDFKIYSIFSLLLIYEKWMQVDSNVTASLTPERTGTGFGMKVGLPGIFFLGAKNSDMTRKGKRFPVNSFLYGGIVQVKSTDDNGTQTNSVSGRYGLGADIFLFNPMAYLTLATGIFTFSGDSAAYTAAGLGFTF